MTDTLSVDGLIADARKHWGVSDRPHHDRCHELHYGCMIAKLADALAALRDKVAEQEREIARVRQVIHAFIVKYDVLEPAIDNAFFMQHIHGMPYKGDTWTEELKALRSMAAMPTEPETGSGNGPSQEGTVGTAAVPYPQHCLHPDKCAGKPECIRDPVCIE